MYRVYHVGRKVTSCKSQNDRIAGNFSLIQLCTWPHFRMSYGCASILLPYPPSLALHLEKPSWSSALPALPPTSTQANPSFLPVVTVTMASAKRPSSLSRSLFPPGRRFVAAVYWPTSEIVSAICASRFSCRRRFFYNHFLLISLAHLSRYNNVSYS